jgi:hypothetical protein
MIPGVREGTLLREDFFMLVVLASGAVTVDGRQLQINGYRLPPLIPETLRIRKLMRLGVAIEVGGSIVPTPEAGKVLVESAEEYGLSLEVAKQRILNFDTVEAARRHG